MYYHVHITPEWSCDTVSALRIVCTTDHAAKAGGQIAARIRELVTIPFCPVTELRFSDESGPLPTRSHNGEAEQSFIYREFYTAQRDSVGETRISYRITPRVQPEGYRSSPYFDLVAEKGGVLGTGTTFLLHLPELSEAFDYSLTWDLSLLPEDCRAVWTYGCGDVSRPGTTGQEMLFSAYMAGRIHASEDGEVGFYWFDTLPFPANEGVQQITLLFKYMSEMFHDKGGGYRVFTRHNHFPGGGGTAFPRSYIYGYGLHDQVTAGSLQSLLAHEMVHNWPTMSDQPAGLGTWYVEGSAEYYSTIVPLEMGICSPEKTAGIINDKAGSYYANPMKHLSNLELGKRYWTDRRCQRLPYSRGMIYLSNLDAQIRKNTGGQHTLLELELALLELPDPTPEDFLRIGSELAGFDLRPGYEQMCAGEMPEPDPDAFGGLFTVSPCMVRLNNAQHRVDEELLEEEVPGYVWSVRTDTI